MRVCGIILDEVICHVAPDVCPPQILRLQLKFPVETMQGSAYTTPTPSPNVGSEDNLVKAAKNIYRNSFVFDSKKTKEILREICC